jgi:hypothetical protein
MPRKAGIIFIPANDPEFVPDPKLKSSWKEIAHAPKILTAGA